MNKKQLDEAISLGFTTQEELKAFEFGMIAAEKEALEKKHLDQELAWLDADWHPVTVIHHTNRDK